MLAAFGSMVHTIEPAATLRQRAVERFHGNPRVIVHAGTSEEVLPRLLPSLRGPVTFWLDGHWSGGDTFRGDTDCPLVHELAAIQHHLHNKDRTVILIDDIRCLDPSVPEFVHYPSLDQVVDLCRAMGFRWHIEHDILIGTRHGVVG
jgi:hypothetical protein